MAHHFVNIAAIAETLHVLPRQGGILDQDYLVLMCVQYALAALHEKQDREQKKANRKGG